MLLKIGNICKDSSDHSICAENLILAVRTHLKPDFWPPGQGGKESVGEGGCGSIRTSGVSTLGSPQASPGDPGMNFPRVLCLSILHPKALIAGELQPC